MKKLSKAIKSFAISALIILSLSIPAFAAQILQYPLFQVIDADGNPVSGGLLYFYAAGTTTLKTAYSDSTLTTAIANPVELNTKGEYPGLIYLDGSYKIDVTESDGTPVPGFSIDNVEGVGATILDFTQLSEYASFAAAVSAIGATKTTLYIDTDGTVSADTTTPSTLDLRFYQGNTLSVATTKTLTIKGCIDPGAFLKFEGAGTTVLTGNTCTPVVYAEWWGAVIGDSTDDLAAIDSALASQTSLTVQLLPGTYNISDTVEIYGTGKHLKGSGRDATIILAADGVDEALQFGISATQAASCSIRDLTAKLDDVSPDATEIGVRGFFYTDCLIDDIRITSFYTGLQLRYKDTGGTQSRFFTANNIQIDEIEDTYVHLTDVNFVNIKGSQFGQIYESLDADEVFLFENTATNITISNNIAFTYGAGATTNTSALHWGTYTATGGTFNINTSQFRNMNASFEFDGAEDIVLTVTGCEFENAGTINGSSADGVMTGNTFGASLTLSGSWNEWAFVGNIFVSGDLAGSPTGTIVASANDGAAISYGIFGAYTVMTNGAGSDGMDVENTATTDGIVTVYMTTATTGSYAQIRGETPTATIIIPCSIHYDTTAGDTTRVAENAFHMFVKKGNTWKIHTAVEVGTVTFKVWWQTVN